MEVWEAVLPSSILLDIAYTCLKKMIKKNEVCLLRAPFSQEEILHFSSMSPSIHSYSLGFKLKKICDLATF